jgi:phosphate transport system substrate-binding protein
LICPNCKRQVPDTARACGYCGHWLSDETAATVQVPADTGATVAPPKEKGRSPWLWIGAGLAVLALVAAVGILAFLALRDGEEMDTEATIAAAVAAPGEAEAMGAGAPERPAPTPAEAERPADERPPAIAPGRLHLAGSSTMLPMTVALAETYMELHPGQAVDVEGGDSDLGVVAVSEGHVDVGAASRDVRPSERERFPDLHVFTIALDSIAVVTHPDMRLPNLNVDQVRAIFAGEITNFAQVGGPDAPIVVFSHGEDSGTRGSFEDLVMGDGDDRKAISADARLVPSDIEMRELVASTPNSIGYLSFKALDGGVWGVPIDGVEPVLPAVLNRAYPLTRPLNLITTGPPDEWAAPFIEFVFSPHGQEIAGAFYIPAEIGAPPGANVYDDFNDPAFEGGYDRGRWRPVSDSPGDFVQEGGALVVVQPSAADSATRLVARAYDFVRLEAPTAFEANLMLDPEARAGYIHLALEAEVPESDEWWWTDCSLYEDWLGCYADLGYQPEGRPVRPGEWHTVRIEVEPSTMTFTYIVDGRVEGTFVPPNAEGLKSANFALKLGIWHDEREGAVVGYIDEVRIEEGEW